MKKITEDPLISIIIPIYNVESYLSQCLESVIHQTYKNLEIILVDDESTDASLEISRKYASLDDRIHMIEIHHAGLSAARNAGLDYANGEFVMFIDSDDYVDERYCEKALSSAIDKNVDIVSFGYHTFTDVNQGYNSHVTRNPRLISKEEGIYELITCEDVIFSYAWNKIFKKELFHSIRFPEGRTFEDVAIMHLIFNESRTGIYVSDDVLYNYRRNRYGCITSRLYSPRSLHDRLLNQFERLAFMDSNYPNLLDSQMISMAKHCFMGLAFLPSGNNDVEEIKRFLKENKKHIIAVSHGLRLLRTLSYYYMPPLFLLINWLMKKYIYEKNS